MSHALVDHRHGLALYGRASQSGGTAEREAVPAIPPISVRALSPPIGACYLALLLSCTTSKGHAREKVLQPRRILLVTGQSTDAGVKLRAYSERMERLLDDMDALKEDIKELKAEIKNDGFNVRALSKLVTIRRNKKTAEVEAELLNDLVLYAHATGTPLDVAFPGDEVSPAVALRGQTASVDDI